MKGHGKTTEEEGATSKRPVFALRGIFHFFSGALAREARSGAPWVRKCGKLPIQENLVIT